jgi:hypothetical protein
MSKQQILIKKWDEIVSKISMQFSDGDPLPIDSIIYLIGIQELGQGPQDYTKDDKINLMHIAVCKLLVPFGYYQFTHLDDEGWPHYKLLKKLPNLNPEKQSLLMKEAIINYFTTQENF